GVAPQRASSSAQAVAQAYARGETDEFILPTVIVQADSGAPVGPINDGDAVFFFNFRADRARQMTYALLGGADWHEFVRCAAPKVSFASMMEYDRQLPAPFAFALPEIDNTLPQVLARAGLEQ